MIDPHKPQEEAWDREYRDPRLLIPGNVPHGDVVRFVKWLKKRFRAAEAATGEPRRELYGMGVLDLGSGTGRNSLYFAERGCTVIGYEISSKAIDIARGFAHEAKLDANSGAGDVIEGSVAYERRDIGAPYPLADDSVDIILDVTSSNSLSETGRRVYLSECARVIKPDGYMFVRALCKDGDRNAKELIKGLVKEKPDAEKDTYVLPGLDVTERVFSKDDFTQTYGASFNILEIEKTTHYAQMNGRAYKRNYWVAYLQPKS
jgi:SAM-dependent methyltransferase